MSSSRPESSTSMDASDFATAPNTPSPRTPLPDLGPDDSSHVPTPQQSNAHLPEADAQDTQQLPQASHTSLPRETHTPLPADDTLAPPMAPYLAPVSDSSSPRDSYGPPSVNDSYQALAAEKPTGTYAEDRAPSQKRSPIFKRPVFWLAAVVALIVLILVVVLPVYFTVIKKNNASNISAATSTSGGSSTPTSTKSGSTPSATSAITGGDGSLITTETGVNFTYQNQFGGFCEYPALSYARSKNIVCAQNFRSHMRADMLLAGYSDPNDPFNNNAQPNSWTPPLNTSWTWGKDKAYGFVCFIFSSPFLFMRLSVQCKSRRSIRPRTFHLPVSLSELPGIYRRMDFEHTDGCGHGQRRT